MWTKISVKKKERKRKLHPTLLDSTDQTRILEWGAFPFSRWSSQPRKWTRVSCIAGRFFTNWATRDAQTMSQIFAFCFCLFHFLNISWILYFFLFLQFPICPVHRPLLPEFRQHPDCSASALGPYQSISLHYHGVPRTQVLPRFSARSPALAAQGHGQVCPGLSLQFHHIWRFLCSRCSGFLVPFLLLLNLRTWGLAILPVGALLFSRFTW